MTAHQEAIRSAYGDGPYWLAAIGLIVLVLLLAAAWLDYRRRREERAARRSSRQKAVRSSLRAFELWAEGGDPPHEEGDVIRYGSGNTFVQVPGSYGAKTYGDGSTASIYARGNRFVGNRFVTLPGRPYDQEREQ